ncbi:hypothetical protein OU094_001787 [Campylobacter coli]|nr:hypothetical protein [Campylobacter coli]
MEAFWRTKDENKEGNAIVNYQEFYFLNDYSDFVLENEAGLLMLHNSWTPYSYKNLNIEFSNLQKYSFWYLFKDFKFGFW